MGDVFSNPGYLLRNTGQSTFELVQTFGQQDRLNSGSAVADFDNDNFPDVAELNTAVGDDEGAPILLHNETPRAMVGSPSGRWARRATATVSARR